MSIPLRQSTASQEIPLGYFLDNTDGDSEVTGLSIANTDIKIWKHGATTLANKNSGGATHISNGIYYAVLDATDTNTLGGLVVFVHKTGALPVRVECKVYPAAVYDSMILGTDYLQTDVIQIEGSDATAQVQSSAAAALTAYDPPTKAELDSGLAALNDIDAATVNAQVDAALADYDGPTKAELDAAQAAVQADIAALNDIDAATVNAQVDTALADYDGPTKAELDAAQAAVQADIAAISIPTVGEIADQVWDEPIAGHSGVAGSTAEALAAAGAAGDPWSTTLPGAYGAGTAGNIVGNLNDIDAATVNAQVDAALADYDGPTKAELDAAQAAVQADIAALNDIDAATVNAQVDAALTDYDGPTKAELDAGFAALNDIDAATVNAQVDTALADYDGPTKAELDAAQAAVQADIAALNDIDAATVNAQVDIALADYDGPTKAELDAAQAAVQADIAAVPTAAENADQVWDEPIAGHSGVAGSTAETLAAAGAAGDPWSTALPGSYGAGTAGNIVGNLNDIDAATVNAQVDAALADYDAPTKAELDAGLAGLNDIDAATVNAQVDAALADYNGPTYAEMAAAFAALNDLSAGEVWEELIASHSGVSGSVAEALANASSAGDPWSTTLPGSYGTGTAGKIIGDIAITVWEESLAAHSGVSGSMAEALNAAGAAGDPWITALPGSYTGSQAGKVIADVLSTVLAMDADNVPGLIAALNDIDAATVNAQVDTALADYDGPTKAELDAAQAAVQADIAALNDIDAATVNAQVDAALADYDAPTKAEMDSGFAALNNIDAATVNAQVDAALADYDGPTKAELDAAQAAIQADIAAVPTAAENADQVWDEPIAGHSGVSGSTAEALAAAGASGDPWVTSLPGAYGAGTAGNIIGNLNDIDAATVNAQVDAALADYDGPTKAELDAAQASIEADIAAISIPTVGEIADGVWEEPILDHNSVADSGADMLNSILTLLGYVDPPTPAEIWAYATRELTAGTRDAEIDALTSAIAALNDIDASGVETAVGNALFAYNAVDDSSLASALAGLNDPTVAEIVSGVWDALLASYQDVGSMGEAMSDAAAGSGGTTPEDVWSYATRELTAGPKDSEIDAINVAVSSGGVAISSSTMQSIAAELLKYNVANVEDSASANSLAALILASFFGSISGTTMTVYKTNGTTVFATTDVTTDPNAEPIVSVGI